MYYFFHILKIEMFNIETKLVQFGENPSMKWNRFCKKKYLWKVSVWSVDVDRASDGSQIKN